MINGSITSEGICLYSNGSPTFSFFLKVEPPHTSMRMDASGNLLFYRDEDLGPDSYWHIFFQDQGRISIQDLKVFRIGINLHYLAFSDDRMLLLEVNESGFTILINCVDYNHRDIDRFDFQLDEIQRTLTLTDRTLEVLDPENLCQQTFYF